ncbi:30S ribosomal protein S20 [Buchnera aphidicola]|uniref:Small ribosomal subunit protein bS20 n=1 Tax=Buchnera aphidicola subsp. Melaphis rhois TaxID=118103 RepID=A0A4D6YAN7_BUCMH|nr:30S ribosomal protein S20 [Buchnera aphidicola]QCI23178.1 30S ribosomal protein S20 [Buchnera aphidicola (Melaphis rhois)]
MANIKSARKHAIQSEKKRRSNFSKKSQIKTLMKKVNLEISSGNKDKAKLEFSKMQSILDRYATKGLIHKNKAARHKSNLEHKIKSLS